MRKLLFLLCLVLPAMASAQIQVQNLPSGGAISGPNYTICDQSGATNKCTFTQAATFVIGTIVGQANTWSATQAFAGITATSVNGSTIPGSAGTLPGSTGSFTLNDCLKVGSTSPLEIADAGPACGSGGSGTVNSGTSGQLAYYAANGTAVSGETTLTATQLGASSAVLADIQANTPFTIAGTGCTPTVNADAGPFSGYFTLAATCTAVTITINGATGFTAPHGYVCDAFDQTLQAAGTWFGNWGNESSTTTTVTFQIPPAAGTTDVIGFGCNYQ